MNYRDPNTVSVADRTLKGLLEEQASFVRGERGNAGDFSRADLRNVNLEGLDLRRASFFKSDMRGANLSGANLQQANLCLVDLTGAGLKAANLAGATLDSADLVNADLSEAVMSRCEMLGTDLHESNLRNAKLVLAYCRDADFHRAILCHADFTAARLWQADLSYADCEKAKFYQTDLEGVIVQGTNFAESSFSMARISNCDLSCAVGLSNSSHWGPSSIGLESVFQSRGKIPRSFLLRMGIPLEVVNYIATLGKPALDFHSCFISYAAVDATFARLLYRDLLDRGVRCWLFEEDAEWGKGVWHEIDKSINMHDRVVVVCSERSLKSGPVLREIERSLTREDREHRDILFPIRIDDFALRGWQHPRKADVTAKVIGDFTKWMEPGEYQMALGRLVSTLRK